MHFDLLNPELTEPDDEQLCEAEEHFSLLLLGVIVYAYGDLEGVRQG